MLFCKDLRPESTNKPLNLSNEINNAESRITQENYKNYDNVNEQNMFIMVKEAFSYRNLALKNI